MTLLQGLYFKVSGSGLSGGVAGDDLRFEIQQTESFFEATADNPPFKIELVPKAGGVLRTTSRPGVRLTINRNRDVGKCS